MRGKYQIPSSSRLFSIFSFLRCHIFYFCFWTILIYRGRAFNRKYISLNLTLLEFNSLHFYGRHASENITLIFISGIKLLCQLLDRFAISLLYIIQISKKSSPIFHRMTRHLGHTAEIHGWIFLKHFLLHHPSWLLYKRVLILNWWIFLHNINISITKKIFIQY